MRKTIITSSNHTQLLRQIILDSQSVLTGIHILPFKASFYDQKDHPDIEFLKNYDILQNLELKKLNELVKFPKILSEFQNLSEALFSYGLDLEDLPSENEYDQDIKLILSQISKPLKKPNETMQYLDLGLKHHEYCFLKNHQIKTIKLQSKIKPKSVQYKTALNFRQELEGAIQYILNEDLQEVALVIPHKDNHAPFVLSVLKRYGLNLESDFNFDLTKKQYISLLNYIQNPSTKNVISILESNVLRLKETENILFFINHFQMNHEEIMTSFYLIEDDTLKVGKELRLIQDKIQTDVQKLQEVLNTLNTLNLDDKLIYALELIQAIHPQGAHSISSYLQNTIQYIRRDNLDVIKYQIEKLSSSTLNHHKIQIYDMNTLPIKPVKHMIVLGLSAKTLPGIKAKTGLLDEAYLSRIQNFPSQTTRNNYALEQKYKIFKKAEHLILSHHAINFEGKAQEPSFPVENFVKTYGVNRSHAWNIVENDPFMDEKPRLSSEIANKLYLKDGYLNASVSSLEKYMSRPYDYFIEEGLALRKPFDFAFDARIIGTFNHEIVENIFSDNPTSYQNLWQKYASYFSKKDALIPLLVETIQETLIDHIENILEIQKYSQFKVSAQETRIFDKETFEGISMRGFIDRIDRAEDGTFMIIDYKSSRQNLSPTAVERGEQLQLLTYAIILRKVLKAPLFGVYYYALNRKRTDEPVHRYLMSQGIIENKTVMDAETYKENFIYEGWTFLDESNYGIIKDVFKNARGGKNFKVEKNFDLDNVESFMKLMLQKIKRNILTGVLDSDTLKEDFIKYPIVNQDGIWSEKNE